jgi:hypothetical protein
MFRSSYFHTGPGLQEVLRQILAQLGWAFRESGAYRTQGDFQTHIILTSNDNMLKIHGEALDHLYKATDSALIYTLDHVDRFFGVNINDIYWTRYVSQFAGVLADGGPWNVDIC